MAVERRTVIDCLVSSACACQQANWSGEDKEEKGVTHIGAFPQGQFTSGFVETSLPPSSSSSSLSHGRRDQFYPVWEMVALWYQSLAYVWKLFSSPKRDKRLKIGDLMFHLMKKEAPRG